MSKEAKIALEILQFYRDRQKMTTYENKKLTFAERLRIREERNLEGALNIILREIRTFTEFELLIKLNEEEAAKRLAIGTVVGKYHKVALKYRGLSVESFQQARDRFIDLSETKLVDFSRSSQEPSVISM